MTDTSNTTCAEGASKLEDACLDLAVARYLEPEGDFNGTSFDILQEILDSNWSALQVALLSLVETRQINVQWEEIDINPHIIRTGFAPIKVQLEYLRSAAETPQHACIFPGREALTAAIDAAYYIGRPYSLELALGAAQLDFRSFDPVVLETYRNDPRYYYHCSDIDGSICISTEGTEGHLRAIESDQVLIQSFGFSYDADDNRCVAVFLRYLHDLSKRLSTAVFL